MPQLHRDGFIFTPSTAPSPAELSSQAVHSMEHPQRLEQGTGLRSIPDRAGVLEQALAVQGDLCSAAPCFSSPSSHPPRWDGAETGKAEQNFHNHACRSQHKGLVCRALPLRKRKSQILV